MTNLVLIGTFTIFAYCSCPKCCKAQNGVTADGHKPVAGRTVGDTRRLPFGTMLYIDGVGVRIVQDRMAKHHHGNKLDVYVKSHAEAKKLGVRHLKVYKF